MKTIAGYCGGYALRQDGGSEAATAYIHALASPHQAKHAPGPTVYAARIRELAAVDDPSVGGEEIRSAIARASPAVRAVVRRMPSPLISDSPGWSIGFGDSLRSPMGLVGGTVMAETRPTLMDFQATTLNKSLQPTLASVGRLRSTVSLLDETSRRSFPVAYAFLIRCYHVLSTPVLSNYP